MANGVWWIGNNGNVYTRVAGQDGVKDYGSYDALKHLSSNTSGIAGLDYVTNGLDQINNPSKKTTAPNQNNRSGGQTHAPLNQAAVNNTQTSIDALPGILQQALDSEAQKYNNTNAQFDEQQRQQQGQYDASTVTNNQNYDKNLMAAIRAGSQGLGGLLSILRGTGAGGGTAEDWARNAVQGATANDISTGLDTQKENQTSLDSSLSSFLTELKGKRQENQDTYENNQRAARSENNTQLQKLLTQMAGYYGDAGDQGNYNSYMERAGALTPTIAADSGARVSAYDTSPVAVKAAPISAFADPTRQSVSSSETSGPTQIGTGIFTLGDKRKENNLVPALA